MRYDTELPLRLDRKSPVPIHWQIYEGLRVALLRGTLAAGTRMPSTRRMAEALSVSRNTVAVAYELLVQEGFVQARRGSGFYVAERIDEDATQPLLPRASADAEARRRAILAAARSLILELGIPRLTMVEISRRAALPPSVIYGSFVSVEAIVAAVARESFVSLRDFMAAAPRSPDPVTAIAAIGEQYVRFAHEKPDLFHLLFHRLSPSAGAPWSWLEAEGSPYGYLSHVVRNVLDRPDGDGDIDEICYFLWAVAHGVASLRTSFLRHWSGSALDRDRAVLRRAAESAVVAGAPAAQRARTSASVS